MWIIKQYSNYIKENLSKEKFQEEIRRQHDLKIGIDIFKEDLDKELGKINKRQLENNFEIIKEILERDCKKFIDESIKTNTILFRGISRLSGSVYLDNEKVEDIFLKKRRKDRYPIDTKREITSIFDNLSYKLFGIKLRSEGVFASKDPTVTCTYSKIYNNRHRKTYIFFPVGDYKYFWNKDIIDFYSKISSEHWYYKQNGVDPLPVIKNLAEGYVSKDLEKLTIQEIIFDCENYYIIDENYYYLIKKWLQKND